MACEQITTLLKEVWLLFCQLSFKKKFLFLTWQLPTNLIALLLSLLVLCLEESSFALFKESILIRMKFSGSHLSKSSFCLGAIIITPENSPEEILLHEYGHSLQSQLLGPFYFLLIGLPSLFRASIYSYFYRSNKNILKIKSKYSYFHCFVEAWADHLGGIYAKHEHKFSNFKQYFWTNYC